MSEEHCELLPADTLIDEIRRLAKTNPVAFNLEGILLVEQACINLDQPPEGHPVEYFVSEIFDVNDYQMAWIAQVQAEQESGLSWQAAVQAADLECGPPDPDCCRQCGSENCANIHECMSD